MRGTAVLFCTDSIGEDAGTERHILELLRDATRREEVGRRSLERCR